MHRPVEVATSTSSRSLLQAATSSPSSNHRKEKNRTLWSSNAAGQSSQTGFYINQVKTKDLADVALVSEDLKTKDTNSYEIFLRSLRAASSND